MKRDRPALLVRVLTEIGTGRITEDYIKDKHAFVHGYTEGRHITINPAIDVVDTVIHEVLHRLQPEWSENYVRRTTTWLLRRMSDEQIQALYEEYQARVHKRRKRGRRADIRRVSETGTAAAGSDRPEQGLQRDGRGRTEPAV